MYEYINKHINKIVDLQKFEISDKIQNIEFLIYSSSCFLVPFLLGHPQFLVGMIVNSLLIMSSLSLKRYQLLPVILLPSVAVLARGMIFGPFTVFLLYFIPFIWIGNAFVVLCFKSLHIHRRVNFIVTMILSALVKSVFLFSVALILYKLNLVPAIFLTSMGAVQLVTSICGGVLAFGAYKIRFSGAIPV